MPRPTFTPIDNGAQSWDGIVNDNLNMILESPFPIHVHTGDESDLETTYAAAAYEDCLVWVNHTVQGTVLYKSNGTVWSIYLGAAGATPPASAQDTSSMRHAGTGYTTYYIANTAAQNTLQGAGNYTANLLKAVPFVAPARGAMLDRIGFYVSTAGGNTARIGLYSNTAPGNQYPSVLLEDSGGISGGTLGLKEHTIARLLNPGELYWLAYEVTGTAMTIRSVPVNGVGNIMGLDPTLLVPRWGIRIAHTVGALPDPFTAGGTIMDTTTVPMPALFMRFSS